MTEKEIIAGYALSDDGNVKRFIDRYGDFIRYCPEANQWIVLEKGQWKIDHRSSRVRKFASQISNEIHKEVCKAESQEDRDAIQNWATTSGMSRHIDTLVRLAKHAPPLIISLDKLKATATDYGTIEWREHTPYWRRKLNLP